jgi:uncharacterized protein involved in exopolysaccharide biosynthesis
MSMTDRELAPGEAGELFDLRQAQQVVGMLFRSVRRHLTRALLAFLAISSAAVFLGYSTPKQYISYGNMQLKPTNISDIIAPNEIRNTADPRKGVKETVLQQKNLEAIVDELKLVEEIKANKSPIGRIFGLLGSSADDPAQERRDAVDVLRTAIDIKVPEKDGDFETSIAVIWTNPVTATNIANRLQNNFLVDRRQTEVAQIETAVAILREDYDKALTSFEEAQNRLGTASSIDVSAADAATLTAVQTRFNDADAKLQNGDLALRAAKIDFGNRYSITQDPQVPTRALTGRVKSYIFGIGAGLLAALFVAALADLTKGAFIESWQITRKLNLPVLAEIQDPKS